MNAPKIGPHANAIRANVAKLLGIPPDCIGVKAKTPEGIGTDNAAIAHAIVLLEKTSSQEKDQQEQEEVGAQKIPTTERKSNPVAHLLVR
jgi:2-C-methyl-D-erythritol 2,4-cyclodiphosphate synthase